jgi:hypothetical protein
MSTRVVERVDDWDEQSFSDGYSGLHDLADREFSGVVRASGAELFMTKGVVVGIRRGTIEDFEGASGTAYIAPTPALPLLGIMQERSEGVRAEYYTEETSLAEVDRTLEDGGFTGFVELSENVLSGDYYLVYHRGRSMSVAYVGNSQRLVQGEEAFEQANDEVGIYEVRPVDIDPIEIPEPAAPEPEDGDDNPGVGTVTDGESPDGIEAESEPPIGNTAAETPDPEPADPETEADVSATVGDTRKGGSENGEQAEEPPSADTEPATAGNETRAESTGTESAPEPPAEATDSTASRTRGEPDVPTQDVADTTPNRTERQSAGDAATEDPESATGERSVPESPTDLETKAIPSLDPERTTTVGGPNATSASRGDAPGRAGKTTQHRPEPEAPRSQQTEQTTTESQTPKQTADQQPKTDEVETADKSGEPTDDQVVELRSTLEEKQATIRELESDLQSAQTARDDARAELATVQEERDELKREVERLQSELSRLEDELGAKMNAERRITPRKALDGTDIFVRYHSKGKETLEKAHDSGSRREDVTENLRLEKHTQFDAGAVSVGGQTYDEFLENRVEFTFAEWVVKDLLFEIQSTGHTETLQDLYDALPEINRIELSGVVATTDEDGEERQESFDIVFRARMGDPLLVANINESRQGATRSMMESLITAAERVGQTNDEFASAFLVTESFFEPEALETVADATRGGLLSRDKRKSFVNLSRKRGYHLCLVEARNENFHLEVPEL